jgi:hypothetical protein
MSAIPRDSNPTGRGGIQESGLLTSSPDDSGACDPKTIRCESLACCKILNCQMRKTEARKIKVMNLIMTNSRIRIQGS